MINVTNFMKFNFMPDVLQLKMISEARKVCAWKSSFLFQLKFSCYIFSVGRYFERLKVTRVVRERRFDESLLIESPKSLSLILPKITAVN